MVIKLGKYLRILGYDAAWDREVRTHELIARANTEQRVFLTRNKRLADQNGQPEQVIILKNTDPVEQLKTLVSELQLDMRANLFSRCVRCNVRLEPVANKEAIQRLVHPNVYARYNEFFTCPHCNTVFWKGSHVRNTCCKLGIARDYE